MNRRDKQRMDERRRESNAPKQKNCEINSSISSKSLMDSYFESQKIIQSLSENPNVVTEVKATKSFKIPKKQPPKIETGRCNAGIDVRKRIEENDFNNSRRNLNNDRTDQNRRFDAERRQLDRRNEPNRFEEERRRSDCPPKRNEFEIRNIKERKRSCGVDTKKALNDDTVDLNPPKKIENNRERDPNDSRRIIRDRFGRRRTDLSTVMLYTTLEKARLKKRLFFNEPIEIIIADRSSSNGKISPENAEIFLNQIKESVAQRILTDPINQTKFIDHKHEDGLITMTCADDFTSVFIQQKLTEELSLWPGAKLEWSFGKFRSCFINLVIPYSIGHISEFLDECKKTDSRMRTEKWRRVECQIADDDSGRYFILAIDKPSYDIIRQQQNVIRCGDLSIKIELDPLNELCGEVMA